MFDPFNFDSIREVDTGVLNKILLVQSGQLALWLALFFDVFIA
jgi:hypothetical protein